METVEEVCLLGRKSRAPNGKSARQGVRDDKASIGPGLEMGQE